MTYLNPGSDASCYRCLRPIKGSFKVVEDKKLGENCFKVLEKRNKIKSILPHQLSQTPEGIIFLETEYCKSSCFSCIHFGQEICPLEENYKGLVGRKR